jgi:hypothetical protein
MTVRKRENGVILANAYIIARVNLGAALTDNDIPRADKLAAKLLYA